MPFEQLFLDDPIWPYQLKKAKLRGPKAESRQDIWNSRIREYVAKEKFRSLQIEEKESPGPG